jgi:hypothetical protein
MQARSFPPTSLLHVSLPNEQKKGGKEREAMIAGTVEFGGVKSRYV